MNNTEGGERSSFLSLYHNKVMLVIILIIVVTLVTDTSLNRISGLVVTRSLSPSNMLPLVLISIAYSVGQFLIIHIIRPKTEKIGTGEKLALNKIHKIVFASQVVLVAFLFLTIAQLVVVSYYSTSIMILSTTVSYSLGVFIMILLAKRFFAWFTTGKSVLLLVYSLAASILAVHLGITLFYTDLSLLNLPSEIRTGVSRPPYFPPGSINFVLNNIHMITSVISFVAVWIATVLLLRNHAHTLGMIGYWASVSLPLVYFLVQFPASLLNLFAPFIKADPFFHTTLLTLLFSLSKPIGGVLFGIAFWIVARRIRQSAIVRGYLIVSAYGFVLLFASEQGVSLFSSPFPPFGLATISAIALASYLIFVGIYYSAISVSQDIKLRLEVKKIVDSRLLDSMGTAQIEQEIRKKVVEVIAKNQESISEVSGIQPSLEQEDLKEYMYQVLQERENLEKKDGLNRKS